MSDSGSGALFGFITYPPPARAEAGAALAAAPVDVAFVGIGEKLGEIYWGPLVGGGIEGWLAYVIALVFLLFRPQGLFGERIIERV